ncbi:MAG: BACON domain-containing protein [Rikenellaceae bacterium]|nr:BACON domain-containing protein [Rikenellaceae bacterium]
MKNIGKILTICALLVFAAGCSDEKADYIKLSITSFTFGPEGQEQYTVKVEARGSWGAEYSAGSWFTLEQEDAQTLLIGATPTRSSAMRHGQITIKSGNAEEVIQLSQLGTNVVFTILEQHSQDFVISPAGTYIGAVKVWMEEGDYFYTPYIMEAETGQITEFPTTTVMYDVASVTDNGILAIIDLEHGQAAYHILGDETLYAFKMPDPFSTVIVGGANTDGSIFVGYGRNPEEGLYFPIKWVDFEPVVMDMPMYTTLGAAVGTGTMARGCSADGSVIYGHIADDNTAIYWKDSEDWQYAGGEEALNHHELITEIYDRTQIIHQVVDQPILTAETTNMSSSGKYLATTYVVNIVQNRDLATLRYPAILDTESGELTIIYNLPAGFSSGWGRTASDHGHLCLACPYGTSWVGYVYDTQTGVTRTITDYLSQEFGFMLQQEEAFIVLFVC